jgi:hypothetical protein
VSFADDLKALLDLAATPRVAGLLAASSALCALASLVAAPFLVVRLPADYFLRDKPHLVARLRTASPLAALGLVAKNLAGATLILAGLAMLVLPGQGLLTIVAGVLLVDFPRKRELEHWLLARRGVRTAVDWLRKRYGREPLR